MTQRRARGGGLPRGSELIDRWDQLLPAGIDPLQEHRFRDFAIEVPVTFWSDPPQRAIRISAHLHNTFEQYRYLAAALTTNLSSLS